MVLRFCLLHKLFAEIPSENSGSSLPVFPFRTYVRVHILTPKMFRKLITGLDSCKPFLSVGVSGEHITEIRARNPLILKVMHYPILLPSPVLI